MIYEDIKFYGFFKAIKYAWQRANRGYDTTHTWEFSEYFRQILPALKKFCEDELGSGTEEWTDGNGKRVGIYKETLTKIEAYEKMPSTDWYKEPNAESEMWKFIGEHIAWYWS